jgi:exodeoxyribonuclease VII large subunit
VSDAKSAPSPRAAGYSQPIERAEDLVEADAVLSVGELDRRLKRLVENGGARVHVVGEVTSLKEVGSGHAYFTLKDEQEDASIDCVMYRTCAPRARRLLVDGARIIVIALPTFYASRGRLQLIVSDARPQGRGALLEALERLKQRLLAEGLFAKDRKRPLPREPNVIGVVTSGSGAAIHDIATVAFRRGNVRILLARANVQGAGAAQKMAEAIERLCQVAAVDAIILGRGGGSADDLSAFNAELLVRKVAESRVPIVSAVGHEVDTTLTDLAADARAATPSQAAELLVPDARAQADAITHLIARTRRAMSARLDLARSVVERQSNRLGTPERLLARHRHSIDESCLRLAAAMRRLGSARRAEVTRVDHRLRAQHPTSVIARARGSLEPLQVRLCAAMQKRLADRRGDLGTLAARLDALSPRAVLRRGYAIAVGPSLRALLDVTALSPGDAVTVHLHRGSFGAEVTWLSGGPSDPPTHTQASEAPGATEPQ